MVSVCTLFLPQRRPGKPGRRFPCWGSLAAANSPRLGELDTPGVAELLGDGPALNRLAWRGGRWARFVRGVQTAVI